MKTKTTFIKSLLSIFLFAILLAYVPLTAFAEGEPDRFIASENANHWGRSDLRAYLNNMDKIDNTLPLDSSNTNHAANYPSQFSNAEFALAQPFSYSTNVLDSQNIITPSCVTTDYFWLPSGNASYDGTLSWGASDVSSNANYNSLDAARAIPISYWSYGADSKSWLRSYSNVINNQALIAIRGTYIYQQSLDSSIAVAAACKIDLSTVTFASSAAASHIAANGGSQTIMISGSSRFGQKTSSALPDYGMYLKTSSNENFEAQSISLSGNRLTVNYAGGTVGKYVVVHAFESDSLTEGATSYVAAGILQSGQTLVTLDVANWGISSLDGLTVKVWMEDASGGASLAKATPPVTFVGTSKTDTGAATNHRVFAMKEDLQTSWGTLANLTDLVGSNPTNQKIYFGTDSEGNPLQFWIAGRETYAAGKSPRDGDGTIASSGEIMTLYQAKSVEAKAFNASTENYKNVPTLTLSDNQSVTYSGSPQGPAYTYQFDSTDLGTPTSISYKYRIKDSGDPMTDGLPTNAGTYEVYGIAAATDSYESATSESVIFTILKATPTYTASALSPINAVYGSSLSRVSVDIGKPTFGGAPVEGSWSWIDESRSVGDVGIRSFEAKFTPDSSNFETIRVDVPVNVMPCPIGAGSVTFSQTEFAYNGQEQRPTVTVIDRNNVVLTEGVDYDITWPNDTTTVGRKTVKIKFKGNYASDNDGDGAADQPDQGVTLSYTVKPARLEIDSVSVADKIFDGTSQATVTDVVLTGMIGSDVLVMGTDYTVTATFDHANAGENKQVSVTITLLSDKAKMYTFDSSEVFHVTTVQKSATISPRSLSNATVELEYVSATYTGKEITPSVSVRVKLDGVNDTTLMNSVDYEISYLNHINVGVATVTVTGIGNFTSSVSVDTLTIEKADIILTAPTAAEDLIYNGEDQTLVKAGSADGGTLEYSLDGTVWSTDLPSAKNEGEYTVYYRVKGDANHKDNSGGSVTVSILSVRERVDDNHDNHDDLSDNDGRTEAPKDGLSGGAIAGIVIGSVAVVGLGGFSLFWFVIKKKKWSDLIGIFKK